MSGTVRSLVVLHAESARFRCVWPTCGGGCCRESRPPVRAGEAARIAANLARVLPHLRPAARRVVQTRGWLTRRVKSGLPTIAVAERYCVFYAEGCVLHRLGASEGDKNRYKPATCITFPLDRDARSRWYVRQKGYAGESWDLPCLDPSASSERAADTLREEIDFVERWDAGLERWRDRG